MSVCVCSTIQIHAQAHVSVQLQYLTQHIQSVHMAIYHGPFHLRACYSIFIFRDYLFAFNV